MKFILQKERSGGTNTATLDELVKKLELAVIKKGITVAKKDIAELKKLPKTKELEDLFDKKFRAKGEPFDLTNAPSIEKNDKIKDGTVYYNNQTDNLRLKKKTGWVTIKTD